jgi:hypothetical protein
VVTRSELPTDQRTGGPGPGDSHGPAGDFLRVSDARRNYFGGRMSLRWWYKQVESGRLPHFRAGGSVLLRTEDIEAFVVAGFRDKAEAKPIEQPPPVTAPPKKRTTRGTTGLRFFHS